MPNLKWFTDMGASVPDLIIMIMGLMFAAYVFLRDRQKDRQIETLFSEVKEINGKYAQLDKLSFGMAIAIQRRTGIKLVKQSANGEGDHTLDRDV